MIKFLPSPCGRFIQIKSSFTDKNARDLIKTINGRTWNRTDRVWEVPIENLEDAKKVFPKAMIHPEITRLGKNVAERTATVLSAKKLTEADCSVTGLKTDLYPYQAVGRHFLSLLQNREGAVLGFDMGLGKSITALASFLDLYHSGKAKRCLVVCPASLKFSTWEKEIKKWTDLSYVVVDGEPFDPKDREVCMEVDVSEWVLDANGKRLFGQEPVYSRWEEVYLTSPVDYLTFSNDFTTEIFPYLPEGFTDLDLPGDVVIEDNYIVAVKMRRFIRFKKRYLKRKTGKTELKTVKLGGKDLRKVQYQQDDRTIVIVNYELFLHDKELIPKIDENWVVILDECHRIKNPRSVTTKNLLKHCRDAGRKFLLSGTPLENNIMELWSIVDFARKGLLGTFYKYKERYLEVDYFGSPIAPIPHLMPELKRKIDPIILRRKKHEVLPDLPPLVEQEYWVDMTDDQRSLYAEIREGILASGNDEDEFTYLSVLAQLTRFQQVLDSPALVQALLPERDLPIESGKLKELWHILEDINIQENKVIIFSQYKTMTDILYKGIVEWCDVEAVRYIHGGTNNQLRGVYQNEFQETDHVRVMIITTAGNYGLDLYKASYVICYDQLFNPQKMNQVIARAHRNGAEQKVTAIHLLTRDSYEERKVKLLAEKKELFGAIIDDDLEFMRKLFTKQELKSLI